MIARIRELVDVARAILRRRPRDVVFASGGPDVCLEGIEPHEPHEPIGVDLTTPGDEGGERYLASRTHAAPLAPPGLAPCPECGTPQQPRDGHMAVHFASACDQRPCVGSWPARKVGA